MTALQPTTASGIAILGWSLMSMNALFIIGINSKSECDVIIM